jgi:ribosomal-protein-alanine N-acetyltransferase
VGAVVVWLIEDEAHIATLCVHPDYRGRGISREILAVALMESIQQGAHLATLEVRANNLIAQALYRRFRFEILGRRPRYYRDNNEDALIMTVDGLDDGYARWLASGGWKK